jgi:predicted nucleotidyltransferase
MNFNWFDIGYLCDGDESQQATFQILQELQIFDRLRSFSPVLVGSIPLGINIQDSDIDIICEVYDFPSFLQSVRSIDRLQPYTPSISQYSINDIESIVINYRTTNFSLEIFGQPQPVDRQHAYRHLAIEYRLLNIGGSEAFQAIRNLKQAGFKTEPAFAKYFNLAGNPDRALLDLEMLDREQLALRIAAGITLA